MLKKLVKALAAAALVGVASSASAGVVFNVNTGNIAGSTTAFNFNADEITITSIGSAVISILDDGDGILDPLATTGDTFSEVGNIAAVNFQLSNVNVPILTSGINLGYELLATYTLAGPTGIFGTDNRAPITAASATIWYDETPNSVIDGGAVAIATLAIPVGGGDCTITSLSSFADGACKVALTFGAVGGGVWNWSGIDISTIPTAVMTLDINVDNLARIGGGPPLPFLNPGVVNQFTNDHDGSAVLQLPEPGMLALLGVAALGGFTVSRRRRGF